MSESDGPSGFWSYVHRDDDGSGGRIARLAGRIAEEFSMLTGQDLDLFVDRDSIDWGDEWRSRISVAIQETTFFLPVVTPRYFVSQECRNELLKFAAHARSLGAEELLLPIYFVDVADLAEESTDEAKALIARTQYADWRDLRLVDEGSESYVRAIHALAARLADISRTYAARPSVTLEEVAAGQQGDGDGDDTDDEPGVMDLIATLEEGLPQWQATIGDLSAPMVEISEIATSATAKIEKGDQEGKGFGYRVVVAREMAAEMTGPAARMEALGEQYADQLLSIDPGVRALIAMVSEPDRGEEEKLAAGEMFGSLMGLVDVSRTSANSVQDFARSLEGPARQFRDLRPVLGQVRAGLTSVLDGQTILEEWGRLIEESGIEPMYSDEVEGSD